MENLETVQKCEYCGHTHTPDPFFCIARLQEQIVELFVSNSHKADKIVRLNNMLKPSMKSQNWGHGLSIKREKGKVAA